MISKSDATGTTQYAWDFENRLIQVVTPSSGSVTYKYDALGRRIQRTPSSGISTNFVYDDQDVLLDLNSSLAVTTSYLNGLGIDDHLRQTNATTGVSYYLTDYLSSTSAFDGRQWHRCRTTQLRLVRQQFGGCK
jgi:YD repeat-containing protein